MGVYPAFSDIRSLSAELNTEAEFTQVNLMEGKNFEPAFLKLNPEGTLPTLTFGSEVYTDTKTVISYLNKKSSSPVAEATDFADLLHEKKYDPNFALLLAVSGALTHQSDIGLT